LKAIRALRDAEQIFGKKDGFYLKTAVKIVDFGNNWFGVSSRYISKH